MGKKIIKPNPAGGMFVYFSYNRDLIDKLKTLDGRRYDPVKQCWKVPAHSNNIKALKDWGFTIPEEFKVKKKKLPAITHRDIPVKAKLRPYQLQGIRKIEQLGGRCLLADEMGLGKTLQAIGWLVWKKTVAPVVIVTPASLKENWYIEFQKFTSINMQKVYIIEGGAALKKEVLGHNIYIINYDILNKHWKFIRDVIKPKTIIADECHNIKNKKAQRTKAFKLLTKKSDYVIGITGTPVLNSPFDIYNISKIVTPTVFPNEWTYKQTYCNPKHNGFGWVFKGATKTEELHRLLTENIMIRRLKKDVAKDLPPKIRIPVFFNIKRDEYDICLLNTREYIRHNKSKKVNILQKINQLKQIIFKEKFHACVGYIKELLEQTDKVVVFAHHKEVVKQLQETFSNSVTIDGSTPVKERSRIEKHFQECPEVKMFIGNLVAAGTGFTLTAASNVVFLEYLWNAPLLIQAEDRVHRITQKNDVNIHYLIAKNTIEDTFILKMINEKKGVSDSILEGEENTQDLIELLGI